MFTLNHNRGKKIGRGKKGGKKEAKKILRYKKVGPKPLYMVRAHNLMCNI